MKPVAGIRGVVPNSASIVARLTVNALGLSGIWAISYGRAEAIGSGPEGVLDGDQEYSTRPIRANAQTSLLHVPVQGALRTENPQRVPPR